jgi:hypothetical protein
VHRLLFIAKFIPTSPIFVNPMAEALRSSATSVLTRAIRRHIPEDDILHSHHRENLKSYTFYFMEIFDMNSCFTDLIYGIFLFHGPPETLGHKYIVDSCISKTLAPFIMATLSPPMLTGLSCKPALSNVGWTLGINRGI